jgi:benzoyl-CoA reductase/2-hydroxyglutaryl-CoA dehydratase subunit BcrC/BadD/HgdB
MTQADHALATLKAAYDDRERFAREAHRSGRKVIGYVSNNVPAELIWPTGAFAVQLTGTCAETTTGDRYMEDFHDGHIRSLFDRILTGQFDFVDAIVIPRSSEGYLQLYYYLLEARKWEPQRRIPEIVLFDILQTPSWASSRYVRGRVDALAARLAMIAGSHVSAAAVSQAIQSSERTRGLLSRLNDLRREEPSRISGQQALDAFATSLFMEPSPHALLVEQILGSAGELPQTTGTRVLVKGTPQDTAGFYAVVESCGARIVADDHVWGERLLDAPDPSDFDDPFEYLTAKYQKFSPSPRLYPQDREDAKFLALVSAAAVEGVIFYLEENDDTLGWDYPAQKKLLDDLSIPSLFMPFQSYRSPDTQVQRKTVQEWLS